MFLLSNIRGRSHREIYSDLAATGSPIFDISEKQLGSVVNADWKDLGRGELVCVISDSHKMSTIYVVEEIVTVDGDAGDSFVVTGKVVGKFLKERRYTQTLNAYEVSHERLKKNKFSIGFNIANLGKQLDAVVVKTRTGEKTIEELEAAAQQLLE